MINKPPLQNIPQGILHTEDESKQIQNPQEDVNIKPQKKRQVIID
jgi:hypothetical protein